MSGEPKQKKPKIIAWQDPDSSPDSSQDLSQFNLTAPGTNGWYKESARNCPSADAASAGLRSLADDSVVDVIQSVLDDEIIETESRIAEPRIEDSQFQESSDEMSSDHSAPLTQNTETRTYVDFLKKIKANLNDVPEEDSFLTALESESQPQSQSQSHSEPSPLLAKNLQDMTEELAENTKQLKLTDDEISAFVALAATAAERTSPSSEFASARAETPLSSSITRMTPPTGTSPVSERTKSSQPSQDVDFDDEQTKAIKDITNLICQIGECAVPQTITATKALLKTTYWTLKAANANKYSRMLFILLLLAARNKSPYVVTITDAVARAMWFFMGHAWRTTLNLTGINEYIPAVRAWAAAQVANFAGVIDTYVDGKIAGFTDNINELLKQYAEEAAVIAQNMVAGAAQTAALNQLRTTFMERVFANVGGAAAGGVATAAMNSILGNIASAASSLPQLHAGGRAPKTTRKSKSNKKRKTRRHTKKTRRTRNRKGGKRRSRRIK